MFECHHPSANTLKIFLAQLYNYEFFFYAKFFLMKYFQLEYFPIYGNTLKHVSLYSNIPFIFKVFSWPIRLQLVR